MRKFRWLLRRFRHGVSTFVRENQIDFFPIRRGFAGYNGKSLRSDATSGLNVALLAFPQGMAYAVIAELPIQYGIVSGAVAAIIAPLFAGSRHTILGPTNATAFMLFASMAAFSAADRLFYLPLLVLMIGVLLTIGSLFRVAELVQYVSRSVVVGYITGAAILIIANQLRHIMGVELPEATSAGPKTFFTILQGTLSEVKQTQWQPVALSVTTLSVVALVLIAVAVAAVVLAGTASALLICHESVNR